MSDTQTTNDLQPVIAPEIHKKKRKRTRSVIDHIPLPKPKLPKFCRYCYEAKEPPEVYKNHLLLKKNGAIKCPRLKQDGCPICGERGTKAHIPDMCQRPPTKVKKTVRRHKGPKIKKGVPLRVLLLKRLGEKSMKAIKKLRKKCQKKENKENKEQKDKKEKKNGKAKKSKHQEKIKKPAECSNTPQLPELPQTNDNNTDVAESMIIPDVPKP